MFVTTRELANFLGREESAGLVTQLEAAESMIAGYIGGDLEERDVTEEHRIEHDLDGEDVIVTRSYPRSH